MLGATEFSIGPVSKATPLSLVLPRDKYEQACLVAGRQDVTTAVLLTGEHTYLQFPAATLGNWFGLIIPGTRIEVDEKSVFPSQGARYYGALVRAADHLSVIARDEQWHRPVHVPVVAGLEALDVGNEAGFTRWQLVVGEGREKRVLWTVNVTPKEAP